MAVIFYSFETMKSCELLKRYAEGERNFRGAQLQDCNFQGQDLRSIDLTGADIRGANFSESDLSGAVLRNVKAGLPNRYLILHGLVSSLLSVVLGIFAGLSGVWISSLLSSDYIQRFTILPAAAVITAFISVLAVIIAARDFSINLLLAILVVSSIVFSVIEFSPVFAFTGLGAIAGYVLVLGIQSINLLLADQSMPMTMLAAAASAAYSAFSLSRIHTEMFAIAIALFCIPMSFYCAHVAAQGGHKFRVILQLALTLRTLGSTSFHHANLTDVDFSYSELKNVNLWRAILTRVRWHHVRSLEHALTNNAKLKNPQVRSLLVALNGYRQSFEGLHLRGVNIDGANLERANFKRADLSDASIREANLKCANLTKSLCVGANFEGAYFTGTCLQEWNINHATNLTGVDCQYVFLSEYPDAHGNRERRPHAPDKVFNPGDFEALYREVTATVQLLLRDEVNAVSFQTALRRVMAHYPDTQLIGVERKGSDTLVTLEVAETADKPHVEQLWDEAYGSRLEAVKTATLLEAERRRADDMKEITLTTVSKLGNVLSHLTIANTNTVVAETRAMINSPDASRKVQVGHVGGDFSARDAALNLGDIQEAIATDASDPPARDAQAAFQPPTSQSVPHASSLELCLQKLIEALQVDQTIPEDEKSDAIAAAQILKCSIWASATPASDSIKSISTVGSATVSSAPETVEPLSTQTTQAKPIEGDSIRTAPTFSKSTLLTAVRTLERLAQLLPASTPCARTLNLLLPLITISFDL